MLIVALAAGFLTAYAIKSVFFEENERQAIDDESVSGLTEQLLVANGDLSAGSELSALNVRLTLTPEERRLATVFFPSTGFRDVKFRAISKTASRFLFTILKILSKKRKRPQDLSRPDVRLFL